MKPTEIKKRKRRRKRRGNSRYAILFFLIGIAVILSVFVGLHFVKKLDYFSIDRVIITGNQNLNTIFLSELANEYIGENLFSVNKQGITQKYENIVRVKKIRVTRLIPGKLRISVTERSGYAYIKSSEGIIIAIDKEGYLLDNSGFYMNEDLPLIHTDIPSDHLISGTFLNNDFVNTIISIHSMVEKSRINPGSISEYYSQDGNIYLVEANNGSRICLGKDDFQQNLSKLEFVMNNIGIEKHTLIDLRYKDQVVFSAVRRGK